jgi:hypothetical protein
LEGKNWIRILWLSLGISRTESHLDHLSVNYHSIKSVNLPFILSYFVKNRKFASSDSLVSTVTTLQTGSKIYDLIPSSLFFTLSTPILGASGEVKFFWHLGWALTMVAPTEIMDFKKLQLFSEFPYIWPSYLKFEECWK